MNEYLDETDGILTVTEAGRKFLDEATSNSHGDVYAFNDKTISATTTAAAMARLSRSPHDMRVTILKEFAVKGKDEALLRRVVTMYGDDSVQQLVGVHVAVENASNLLTKYVEWGRLAAYLEQSTRYIFYDEKDVDGNYKYFVPERLSGPIREEYITHMDSIFEGYSDVVRKLYEHISQNSDVPDNERDGAWRSAVRAQACDAARLLLPVATKSTVGIFGSSQAIESMIMRLRAHPNDEARACGESILREVRKIIPAFFDRADQPNRGGGTSAYLTETEENVSNAVHSLFDDPAAPAATKAEAKLVAVTPLNELEVASDIAYDKLGTSLEDIKNTLNAKSDETKRSLIDAYVGKRLNRRHRPGRAFENIHYTFDIVCDYGIFRDLQRHRLVNDLRWQKLTPNLGFETPQLVKDANLEDAFKNLFQTSEDLYTSLLSSTDSEVAQYATLLGHNMRWRISFNAREAFHLLELRTAPQGHPGYRKLCKQMFDQIKEVHPVIAGHMIFINKDEDPALTRLAAERASQRKLEALDS